MERCITADATLGGAVSCISLFCLSSRLVDLSVPLLDRAGRRLGAKAERRPVPSEGYSEYVTLIWLQLLKIITASNNESLHCKITI
ncbi:hypothetical protein JRQ81_004964 [Phrynocephalus forsythii]|uniref:Uncharacterized protein n=1 Tax=Phrynocephalus forsythii TaxID=171643 RepID=A0A9Q0XGL8_9SAUR|nr:hypothetical protein JRQ81_004964 [Phrynocephalus forsythii]